MASAPSFEPVDDIGYVEVADIDLGERLRPVDRNHVEVLGRAMMREGQITPIVVCRLPGKSHWTLVAGAHRVEAARKFGIEQLKAEIIGADSLQRKQHEVSENLWRKGLDPIERASFIAELVRLTKLRAGIDPDRDGRAVSAAARWQKTLEIETLDANAKIAVVYGWTKEVASAVGLSERALYDDLLLYKRLSPTVVEALRRKNHPVLKNAAQLKKLAGLDESDQKHLLGYLIHAQSGAPGAPFNTVSEALAARDKKPKPDAEQKRLSTFLDTFERMGVAERKGAMAQLIGRHRASLPDIPGMADRNEVDTLRGAIDKAMTILVSLIDGEPVDDEQLQEAAGECQEALALANTIQVRGQ